ncbi:MAG TPA: DUF1501 domain-containing protein [Armatimonadota bacterium]|nr:DUF1501 domain-containing protein [Armatimonadota bacterium]
MALTRRDFLKSASAAALAAMAAGEPVLGKPGPKEPPLEKIKPTADTLIVLWLAGGMAHTETFDPKRYTPYEVGLASSQVLSTFPAIPTVVDGIQFSQGLEQMAKIMDRGTLMRSYVAGDLGKILHTRHQYQWHTGYAPPQTVAAPHIGAVIARTLGPVNPAVPAFVDIGQRLDVGEGEELKAFHTAGFLGGEYGPFMIPQPAQAADTVRPAMSTARFENREKFYRALVAKSPVGIHGSDYQRESLIRSMESAHRLLSSPAAKAFDLAQEPKASYDRYNTGRFGLGCLLARRLTDAGARFIEVTSEYIPFQNWDTHENGHTRTIGMKQQVDGPISQLVLDLERSGRLDRTLIVVASEFSRDMLLEGRPGDAVPNQVAQPDVIRDMKFYGMHRHFTGAGSVLMFGGGVKKGFLYGKTSEERPCGTIENPVRIPDLHATIYHALGISPRLSYTIEQRPFYVTKDGVGKPIMDVFA